MRRRASTVLLALPLLLAPPALPAQGPAPRAVGIAPALRTDPLALPARQGSGTSPSGATIGALVGAGVFVGTLVIAAEGGGIPGNSRGQQLGLVALLGASFIGLGALVGAIVSE